MYFILFAFKVSTWQTHAPSEGQVRDLVGVDHMVMGSDYPHLLGSIERSVSSIQDLAIPEYEKERIFSSTAMSILNNVA